MNKPICVRINFLLAVALGLCALDVDAASSATMMSQPLTVERLAQMQDIVRLEVSPDERWAAALTRQPNPETNNYTQTWHRVAVNGGHATTPLADGGPPYLSHFSSEGFPSGFLRASVVAWSPDSRWLAFTKLQDGRSQVWRVRYDGRKATQLTNIDDDVVAVEYSDDGEKLIYQTAPSQDRIGRALEEEGLEGFIYDDRISIYGGLLPAVLLNADMARKTFVYDFKTRQERTATAAEVNALERAPAKTLTEVSRVRNVQVRSTKGDVAWVETRGSNKQASRPPLTVMAKLAEANEESICVVAACTNTSIRGLWWWERASGGPEVIFGAGDRKDGPPSNIVYAWLPDADTVRTVAEAPGILRHCNIAHNRLVCIHEAPAFPRRVIAIDLVTGEVEKLFDPNADLADYDFGRPPQWMKVPTSKEFNSYGYLILPPDYDDESRLPLVIVGYRCFDYLRGGTGDEYPIYPLAAEGFAVFCFEPPLDDFKVLAEADAREYLKYVFAPGDPRQRRIGDALDAAIDQLDEMGVIDSDRVGLTGFSSGAQMVNYALYSSRHDIAAAISSYALFDPVNYHISGPAGRDWFRSFGLAGSDETTDRWQTITLRKNIEKLKTPVLFNVADREVIMTLSTVNALQDAEKPVEMRIFPNEYHQKWQPAHRLAIYRQNIDWMKFWLLDEEDTDPDKAAQYERWRGLREMHKANLSTE